MISVTKAQTALKRTTSKPAGTGGTAHFPGFDGLRAIAALTVIAVHTTFASGFTGRSGAGRYTSRLEIGVEVFFVISGFLLYRPFAVEHFGGKPALGMRSFWARRLRRIIPAYWFAFLVISYVLHGDTVRHAWYAPLIYLGFAQIYIPYYTLSGVTQAWSLCTEMSFYLMIPLWAALMGSRRRASDERRTAEDQLRVELIGLLALVAISFAYRIPVLMSHGSVAQVMPNWLPAYLDQFALGMFLAVTSSWLAATGRKPAWLERRALPWVSWALAFLAFVAVSNIGLPLTPVTPSPVGPSLLRQTLYGLFAFFTVAPAVFGPPREGLIRRFLQFRPLALIGVVSYGVYLWHESWMTLWFRWTGDRLFTPSFLELYAAVAALAVASATLSYRLVERPILRWRRSPAPAPAPAPVPVPARAGGELPALGTSA